MAIALVSVLGGIALSLLTNLPVSPFVTSIGFASYLLARFAAGRLLAGDERSDTIARIAGAKARPS